jgi:hypothetical protein
MSYNLKQIVGIMVLGTVLAGDCLAAAGANELSVDTIDALQKSAAAAQPGTVITLADGTCNQAIRLAGKGVAGISTGSLTGTCNYQSQ